MTSERVIGTRFGLENYDFNFWAMHYIAPIVIMCRYTLLRKTFFDLF